MSVNRHRAVRIVISGLGGEGDDADTNVPQASRLVPQSSQVATKASMARCPGTAAPRRMWLWLVRRIRLGQQNDDTEQLTG